MNTYFNIKKKLEHFSIDIEYEFEKGVLVIQGESGAGKTTILNCISGLQTPDEGRIAFEDTMVFDKEAGINVPTRLRNIGYVFQNYALFPNMTVQQNIVYGIKNRPEYKDKDKKSELVMYSEYIMETFGIAHLKRKYPNHISGGEKQRVALSRAIVTKPRLLLLDEPFSALDQQTKEIVYKEFAAFKENFQIPTVLITHDAMESEMFADRRIVIKDGKIIEKLL
ncbi:ATP-binding cassette domain-containing protein [Sinanaerobacter chloroacetimidivorans]|jgi:molybdate transport system ATP-binding protein|uniref:ATP-binding cassette domain-containing protein n=1 Tax=Sinanaerobacter chloroacetimidivorans TaxID=2818044 RepID=A0A8J8B1P1_9FIRM|nr:ATP-binding cassette domain-containing protein [Sinanaerobacter chloroacetimidivorans]MBR0597937.1 ATP-binding cassette domain-containing protein [Sinanaerobacter chloroacetimidivorans]